MNFLTKLKLKFGGNMKCTCGCDVFRVKVRFKSRSSQINVDAIMEKRPIEVKRTTTGKYTMADAEFVCYQCNAKLEQPDPEAIQMLQSLLERDG